MIRATYLIGGGAAYSDMQLQAGASSGVFYPDTMAIWSACNDVVTRQHDDEHEGSIVIHF
jgi:hypothetical protein